MNTALEGRIAFNNCGMCTTYCTDHEQRVADCSQQWQTNSYCSCINYSVYKQHVRTCQVPAASATALFQKIIADQE